MRPKPDLVDFHCHLDLYPDLERAVATCDAQRAATLAVTTTPKAFPRNRDVASTSSFVRVALGLHPQLAGERSSEMSIFERLLPETCYVGEVGLDAGPRFYRTLDLQIQVFRRVLRACAEAGGKILTIHSVRATRQVLDLLETHLPQDRNSVVLHWFTGSAAEARRAVELGCYFSLNERMTGSVSGQKIARTLPLDRILTETDGPFVEKGGRPIAPGDVSGALEAIARIRQLERGAIRRAVLENLRALLVNASTEAR